MRYTNLRLLTYLLTPLPACWLNSRPNWRTD